VLPDLARGVQVPQWLRSAASAASRVAGRGRLWGQLGELGGHPPRPAERDRGVSLVDGPDDPAALAGSGL
jgi:hypothetical protein